MEATLKRKVAIGAAGLALLGAAGGTYAATRGSRHDDREAFLNDVAGRLKVSPSELKAALRGAFFDRLDAAVAAGRIRRADADAIKRRVRERSGAPPFFGGGPFLHGGPRGRFLHGGPGGPFIAAVDAAAEYLGITVARLSDELESGRSLAQVVRDRGKSVDGLKSAIKGAVRRRLDAAVAEKRLTRAQEQHVLSRLDRRIDQLVQRAGPRPRFLGPRPPFHGRPGFRGAPHPGVPRPRGDRPF